MPFAATLVDGTPFEIDLNTLPPNPGDDFVDFNAILTVTLISLPGDYNNDGVVDAADYAVWRDHVGEPAGTLVNDINGGPIGDGQYQVWADNYGATIAAASQAIPEPATRGALALGLLVAVRSWRRS